jgi:uncharacterized membrane protein
MQNFRNIILTYLQNKKFLLTLILFVFGSILLLAPITNHYYFRSFAYDYGIYNFAFWDYAHFHISNCPVYVNTNMSYLQDHFSLCLMFLVPFYWLMNWLTASYTLLILQTAIILLSGWAVYRLVTIKTGDEWLGISALLLYFLLYGRYATLSCDCNIAVFAACLVPLFLYFFESERYLFAILIFLLAILSKENMSIWFIFIIPVIMIWHRKNKKVLAICGALIILSILYFIVLFKVFIPMLETPEKSYGTFNYSVLGITPTQVLLFIFKHPIETLKLLFVNHSGNPEYDGVKFEFYYVYLISGGFILFYRPQYLLWFIPIVGQKMFNDIPLRWSIETYYSIELVTLLPVAVFLTISEIKQKKWQYRLAVIICILTITITGVKLNPSNREIGWGGTGKENIFDQKFFKSKIDLKKTYQYLKLIPPGARVSASQSIVPHLAQRKKIYCFPKVNDAEYLAVFIEKDAFPLTQPEFYNELSKYISNPQWKVVVKEFPFLLLKRE